MKRNLIKNFSQFKTNEEWDPFGIAKRRREKEEQQRAYYKKRAEEKKKNYEISQNKIENKIPESAKKLIDDIFGGELKIVSALPRESGGYFDSDLYQFILSDGTKMQLFRSSADECPIDEVDIHDCFMSTQNIGIIRITDEIFFELAGILERFLNEEDEY